MMNIDRTDQKILRRLQKDGRISNVNLAETVGLSPSACLRRVQDLEKRGAIIGYKAVIDRKEIGRDFLAYVTVSLSDHSREAQRNFEAALEGNIEVSECHSIAGSFEYLLRVETQDVEHYRQFHDDVLGTIKSVSAITTLMVLHSPKDRS